MGYRGNLYGAALREEEREPKTARGKDKKRASDTLFRFAVSHGIYTPTYNRVHDMAWKLLVRSVATIDAPKRDEELQQESLPIHERIAGIEKPYDFKSGPFQGSTLRLSAMPIGELRNQIVVSLMDQDSQLAEVCFDFGERVVSVASLYATRDLITQFESTSGLHFDFLSGEHTDTLLRGPALRRECYTHFSRLHAIVLQRQEDNLLEFMMEKKEFDGLL